MTLPTSAQSYLGFLKAFCLRKCFPQLLLHHTLIIRTNRLALIIFFAILPMICTMLSRAQGFPSESIINEEMMKKLYLFFVVNIFVGSIVGGSLLSDTDEIFDKPVDVLGKSIPETGDT